MSTGTPSGPTWNTLLVTQSMRTIAEAVTSESSGSAEEIESRLDQKH
jgi:hypothetical protein